MSTQQNKWTTLNSWRNWSDKLISTSNNTFASWSIGGLFEYSIINDQWTKIIQYPEDITDHMNSDSVYDFDKKNQLWYFYNLNPHKPELITFNCITNDWQFYDIPYFGSYVGCTILNNKFNIIGGRKNNKHLIWNDNTMQQIYEFNEYKTGYYLSQDICNIQSKNMLLLFGGTDQNNLKKLGVVYKYNILKQEWNKLSVKMPKPYRVNFGVTSVMNDRYILLFGGWLETSTATDVILIYCVSTQTFSESKIRCPEKGIFKAITMNYSKNDELTVFGYVRQQWNLYEMSVDMFPPFYLVKLIQCWYWTGKTYLIEINSGKHWKIDTLELL
eukprot:495696_1